MTTTGSSASGPRSQAPTSSNDRTQRTPGSTPQPEDRSLIAERPQPGGRCSQQPSSHTLPGLHESPEPHTSPPPHGHVDAPLRLFHSLTSLIFALGSAITSTVALPPENAA